MNKPLQTLVILTPAFPKNESETGWVPTQQILVRELKKQFPLVNIVVLSFLYPYEKTEYNWHGVNITAFGGINKRKLKRLQLWQNTWKKLREIRKGNNIIGILSFWCGECALVGRYFSRMYGIKHYCWICGQDARKQNRYVKFIRPPANELVAISDFVAGEFCKNHGTKPGYTIPNAIDQNMFSAFAPEKKDIDVLAVASIHALKQYNIFVSVIKTLKSYLPGIKAVQVGDGEEKETLKMLINGAGVSQDINLSGMQPHEEVLKLMQRSKILLHPSAYEGFSTVCLEALYAGAHVISFVKPMDHEIKNWHIVKTEEEMGKKALELLSDSHIQHEQILVYSMENIAKQFMSLFHHNITI